MPYVDKSILTNGYLNTTIIDWVPDMPPMTLSDFTTSIRTTDPHDFQLQFYQSMANSCTRANALILNTIDALEADVLAALQAKYQCIYTIGPVGSLLRSLPSDDGGLNNSIRLSLWKQDAECIPWLDTQKRCSVV